MNGIGPLPALLWPVSLRVALVVAIGAAATIGVRAIAGRDLTAAWSRVAVWAAAAALLLTLDAAGPLPFGLLMAVLAVQGTREVSAALRIAGVADDIAVALTGALVATLAASGLGAAGFVCGLGVALLAVPLAIVRRHRIEEAATLVRIAATLATLLYVAAPLGLLTVMRWRADGFALVAWTILVVGSGDAAAMYGGLAFGRTRIAPRLSPGKTLEGLLAGLVAACGAAALMRFALPGPGAALYYATALAVALAGFAGDLVASAIKRAAGIKDFGAALPGHGGVMDRLDSQLYGAPVALATAAYLWP